MKEKLGFSPLSALHAKPLPDTHTDTTKR